MQVSRIVYFALALTRSLVTIEIPEFLLTEIERHAWIGKRVIETTRRIVN